MNRKIIVAIVACIVLLAALGSLWLKNQKGYRLLCDGNINIEYSVDGQKNNLYGTMSLHLSSEFTGEMNISGNVTGSAGTFHVFRTTGFHYNITDAAKGLLSLKLENVTFYWPDSDDHNIAYWPVNKSDIGKSMLLVFNKLDDKKILISNLYSPMLVCNKR